MIMQLLRTTAATMDWSRIRKQIPGRTMPAIRSKLRKLRIKHDAFGRSYRGQKDSFLEKAAAKARPSSVFDAYAGSGRQTFLWAEAAGVVYASEKNAAKQEQFLSYAQKKGFAKQKSDLPKWILFRGRKKQKVYFWRGDAVRAAAALSAANMRVDLVDLDTCGTTLPSLPIFLSLLRPAHLTISYGESHSFRFGREDVLRRVLAHRSINSSRMPKTADGMAQTLHKATLAYALRAHNEIHDALWLKLVASEWLGGKNKGMLRRHYQVAKPPATADCLNELAGL